jgi:hypothetical protein
MLAGVGLAISGAKNGNPSGGPGLLIIIGLGVWIYARFGAWWRNG